MKKEELKNIGIFESTSKIISVKELVNQFECAIKSCWGAVDNNEKISVEKDDLKAIIKKVAFYLDLE